MLNERRLLLVFSRWRWLAAAALTSILLVLTVAALQVRAEPYVATVHLVPKPNTSVERRQALAILVSSPDLARQVLSRDGSALPSGLRSVDDVLAIVQGVLPPGSDLVSVEVRTADRNVAEQMAVLWATQYAAYVNQLYGANVAGGRDVGGEVAEARKRYEEAQSTYVAATGASTLGEHERTLAALEDLIRDLRAATRAVVVRGLVRGEATENGLEPLVAMYEEEARDLRGMIVRELGALRLLEAERDVAQTAYVELMKQAEQRRATPAPPPEIALASQTSVAEVAPPRMRSLTLLVPLAGVLGAAAAGIAVILWDAASTARAQLAAPGRSRSLAETREGAAA